MYWYGLKVFYNRSEAIDAELREAGYETYLPYQYSRLVDEEGNVTVQRRPLASLLFLRAYPADTLTLRRKYYGRFLFYDDPTPEGTRRPTPISLAEMELFKKITSVPDPGLEYLPYDPDLLQTGRRVRVTGGPFEGTEGVIKRIRHDRRFLIEIKGICLVATSYIPQAFLHPLD